MELSDSRNADDWKNHFECPSNNGIKAIYLVSDDGTGIRAGHAEVMSDGVRQSDTCHAIAHRLGSRGGRLETAAYAAIEKEYDCEKNQNRQKVKVFKRNGKQIE